MITPIKSEALMCKCFSFGHSFVLIRTASIFYEHCRYNVNITFSKEIFMINMLRVGLWYYLHSNYGPNKADAQRRCCNENPHTLHSRRSHTPHTVRRERWVLEHTNHRGDRIQYRHSHHCKKWNHYAVSNVLIETTVFLTYFRNSHAYYALWMNS